jgi:[protein-PII] uridylyltransferase
MTIVDVRIVPLANGFSLDTYVFMGLDNRIEVDDALLNQITLDLEKVVGKRGQPATQVTRPTPRQVRMFTTKTRVNFDQDITNHRTIMELIANDRPGLLSTVGKIFVEFDVYIENAKIVTVGERAEDVFYLTDLHGSPLSEKSCKSVRDKLIQSLDNQI